MILGVDPGLNGAVALVDHDTAQCLRVWDMPALESSDGRGRQVNAYMLADIVNEAIDLADGHRNLFAHVEKVGAMPGQGVSSMFKFGHSAGVVAGVLGGLYIRAQLIRPTAWKRHHGLTGRDKDAARYLAINLFPEMLSELKRKKDVDRAEAILLAAYNP